MVNKEKLAEYMSFILGPQIWFPVLLLLLFLKTGLSQEKVFILAPLVVFFQMILPFLFLYWFIKTKRISDWDIRKREERYKILPIFATSTFIAVITAYYIGTKLFFYLYLVLWTTSFIGVLVTYKWKISLHLMLNTAAVLLVNFLFGWNLPFLYLLILIIGWARYYHKHHTISQITGGVIISGIIVLSFLKFLGYL